MTTLVQPLINPYSQSFIIRKFVIIRYSYLYV